jgi:hypothetical protein
MKKNKPDKSKITIREKLLSLRSEDKALLFDFLSFNDELKDFLYNLTKHFENYDSVQLNIIERRLKLFSLFNNLRELDLEYFKEISKKNAFEKDIYIEIFNTTRNLDEHQLKELRESIKINSKKS